jgi:hypothetical protein
MKDEVESSVELQLTTCPLSQLKLLYKKLIQLNFITTSELALKEIGTVL